LFLPPSRYLALPAALFPATALPVYTRQKAPAHRRGRGDRCFGCLCYPVSQKKAATGCDSDNSVVRLPATPVSGGARGRADVAGGILNYAALPALFVILHFSGYLRMEPDGWTRGGPSYGRDGVSSGLIAGQYGLLTAISCTASLYSPSVEHVSFAFSYWSTFTSVPSFPTFCIHMRAVAAAVMLLRWDFHAGTGISSLTYTRVCGAGGVHAGGQRATYALLLCTFCRVARVRSAGITWGGGALLLRRVSPAALRAGLSTYVSCIRAPSCLVLPSCRRRRTPPVSPALFMPLSPIPFCLAYRVRYLVLF